MCYVLLGRWQENGPQQFSGRSLQGAPTASARGRFSIASYAGIGADASPKFMRVAMNVGGQGAPFFETPV